MAPKTKRTYNLPSFGLLLVITILVLPLIILILGYLAWLLHDHVMEDWESSLFVMPFNREFPRTTFRKPPQKVVQSVATVGGRVQLLLDSIPTILNQTWPYRYTVVTVTKYDSIDRVLKELASLGPFEPCNLFNTSLGVALGATLFSGPNNLIVQFHKRDWGPGTKLVAAYLLTGPEPNTVILTMDDDSSYPPTIVQEYLTHMPPGQSAVASSCEEPRREPSDELLHRDPFTHPKYSALFKHFTQSLVECKGWLVGWTGAAYWASVFDDTLVDYLSTLPETCFFYDDVWISGWLHEKGVKRYMFLVPPQPTHLHRHPTLSISGSHTVERMMPCVNHFDFMGFKQ